MMQSKEFGRPSSRDQRVRGLRRIQVWVPETRSEKFRAEAHCQSLAVAQSEGEREDQTFIEAISDHDLT
ncbi:MAG: DUF3018 family protein [Gemmatimonadetes bacterium]|nr:antitoxin MazE family protein [Gemmatimonadota bacterium]MXW77619.1 DUF3018 family protein [Gemmatimonadota bacterium]MYC73314.1 DUF3018 family protein [Gemmatimonadota bacterium]MYI62361.1 DUF3018 family protein [Gemmatimonadota bacterium]